MSNIPLLIRPVESYVIKPGGFFRVLLVTKAKLILSQY